MTFSTDGPVVSGQRYLVTAVDGRRPEKLDDFVGDVEMTLLKGDTSLSLIGAGAHADGAVHLCQKERGPIDRDVRSWTVVAHGDRKFTAEPNAAF